MRPVEDQGKTPVTSCVTYYCHLQLSIVLSKISKRAHLFLTTNNGFLYGHFDLALAVPNRIVSEFLINTGQSSNDLAADEGLESFAAK